MSTACTPVTVVIPARNEAANIERCLDAIARQTHRGAVRIVVVVNGSSDCTEKVAQAFVDRLPRTYSLVIHTTPGASKCLALNAGDEFALEGHRIYLDADTVLSPNAIGAMTKALDAGDGVHLCAPRRKIREPRGFLSRCYAQAWSALPYVENAVIFNGVYGVSATGRKRWSGFPPLHSEDKFVRLHFGEHESRVLDEALAEVQLPEGARRLFRARLRWCRGNGDLCRRYPELSSRDRRRYRGFLQRVLTRPSLWIAASVFVALHVSASILARTVPRTGQHHWER